MSVGECNKGYYKSGTNNNSNCHPCPDGTYTDRMGEGECKIHITKKDCTDIGKSFKKGGRDWASYCY